MGQRGPQPQPTESKRLRGNPGHRRLNNAEPTPPQGAPEMPEHFNEDAQKAWRWLCGMLGQMNLLSKSDVAIMSLYCDTWSEYIKVRRDVDRFGYVMISKKTGMPFMTPHLSIESMLKKQLMQILPAMGLTASSRSQIHVTDNGEKKSIIEELMTQRYGPQN